MLKISLTSRLLDILGRIFIGSPSELLVLEDFYYLPGDRKGGSGEDYKDAAFIRQRITANNFRRNLFVHVYRVSTAISAVLCAVLFFALMSVNSMSDRRHAADAMKLKCDIARMHYNSKMLSAEQERIFIAECGK